MTKIKKILRNKILSKYLLALMALLTIPILTFAQHGTTASGNSISNDNVSIGYTIGETIPTSYTNTDFGAKMGILQPTFSESVSTIDIASTDLAIYPNPTASFINVKTTDLELISYQIFSIDGKLLDADDFENQTIDISSFAPGTYVLNIISNSNSFSTLIHKHTF